ncbi:ATP-grasp domain-containing protein [Sphingomonas endolithica]|uniref:ATP-grasp domain-containing protein n=1 Tax=Sphingomonas endolithica TaxID=2972485 RepID=UPI0021AF9326|nr:hypothetical protein [Sphingomonas sp. ZFBP2030]
MTTIDVLMPVAGNAYAATAPAYLDTYRPAFAAHGLTLNGVPWDEAAGTADATLALFAWGYHLDVVRWEEVLARWPSDRPLLNPPSLLRWNTRKTYLFELADRGVPIVPSIFGDADEDSAARAFDAFGCDELVIKPQVSGGSHKTVRVRRGESVAPLSDAILQPFLQAVGDEGELSLLFVGGLFSHAVRKVAAAGEFRIQPQFGGVLTRFKPAPEQLAQAKRVVAALPAPPLYARSIFCG